MCSFRMNSDVLVIIQVTLVEMTNMKAKIALKGVAKVFKNPVLIFAKIR